MQAGGPRRVDRGEEAPTTSAPGARPPRQRRDWGFALVVGTAVAAGLALRAWVLASPLGALDSDEAIVGLMARHALEGEFYVLYWLSYYGGSQEPLLTAAAFAVTGSSVLALKLVALSLFALAAVLVWRIGVATVGEPAARIGAALFWVWPPFFVWWSTKARGYYALGLVCGLLVLLLVLRLRRRDSVRDAVALGLILGFGVWATLQTLLLAGPALAWLASRRPRALLRAWPALPAFVVGAAPWLAWNVRYDWVGIVPSAVAGEGSSYFGRLADFFTTVLPTWLGLREPYSLDWTPGPVLGIALLLVALGGFGALVARRPPGLEPLLAVGVLFPFVYAASSFTYFVAEPRYLIWLSPVPALLLGRLVARRAALAAAALALALVVSATGLVALERGNRFAPLTSDRRVPADLGPLIELLEREGEDRVLADYWIAYRLSFESRERIVATSTGFVRYQPHDRLVRSDPRPAYVFVAGSAVDRAARARLEGQGYRRLEAGGFSAYVRDASPPEP